MKYFHCALFLASMFLWGVPTARPQSQDNMAPFTMDHRSAALTASPVDVSFLLDAPAGKDGFIQVRDGHLVDGNGKRFRFWGVNITDWSSGSKQIPEKQDAVLYASTLARFGINSARFQFLDLEMPRGLLHNGTGNTQTLDTDQLDREDFFISELEKRGIYIDFNLLVGRPFSEGDGVKDAKLLRQGAKGTSFFDARLIELQKQYAHELLSHKNPYTGRTYIEDPAVAVVEINNENAINVGYRAPSPFYQEELTGLYNRWLNEHRSSVEVAKLRSIAGVSGDLPVPLIGPRQSAQTPEERFLTEASFFNDLQHDYFADMESYIKQTIGSKSLVLATADHSHSGSGYPILLAMSSMDIIDGHDYWQHPESYVRKSPMVNDPANSTVVELSRSAIAGKPYTVSEVNEAYPNDYAGEQIPILAAYASLQDWDGIFWYTFEPKSDPKWKPYVGDPFDISLDPVRMPELAEGSLMFLRGDIRKANKVVSRSYSETQVFDSMLLPPSERPYFTQGFPLDSPLEDEVRISSLNGAPTTSFARSVKVNPIISDTHELAWYSGASEDGLVTIDSPRTQALIGFVHARASAVRHLSADVSLRFCTLLLSSMTDEPIATSNKILLIAGGPVENSGQTWNAAHTDVTAWGESPTLIEQVKGTITLRELKRAHSVSVQPINGAGQPLGTPLQASPHGDDWTFPVGGVSTTWYQITVRR